MVDIVSRLQGCLIFVLSSYSHLVVSNGWNLINAAKGSTPFLFIAIRRVRRVIHSNRFCMSISRVILIIIFYTSITLRVSILIHIYLC
jgi:hypothetical protein